MRAIRYTLRSPAALQHCMQFPGRGAPHSTHTLAAAVGCHHSLIARLAKGKQETCDKDYAHDIAETLGVAVLVLFAPPPSPDQTVSAIDQQPPT